MLRRNNRRFPKYFDRVRIVNKAFEEGISGPCGFLSKQYASRLGTGTGIYAYSRLKLRAYLVAIEGIYCRIFLLVDARRDRDFLRKPILAFNFSCLYGNKYRISLEFDVFYSFIRQENVPLFEEIVLKLIFRIS